MIAINVERSRLAACMMRLDASASNVANADSIGSLAATTSAKAGSNSRDGRASYQPMTVEQRATTSGGVAATYGRGRAGAVPRYDPSSPSADGSRVVAAPAVDLVAERVEQLSAVSAFRASVAVIRAADQMQKSAIDLIA